MYKSGCVSHELESSEDIWTEALQVMFYTLNCQLGQCNTQLVTILNNSQSI